MSLFSERLKKLRLEKGENQSDVAVILGVSVQSYSAYEGLREPKYDSLIKLAQHFNVTTDYLLGNSEVRMSENKVIHSDLGLTDKSAEELREWKDAPINRNDNNKGKPDWIWKDILNIVLSCGFFGHFIRFLALRADPLLEQKPDTKVYINEYEKMPAILLADTIIGELTKDLIRAIKKSDIMSGGRRG